MKLLLNIFIVFILSACATTEKYEAILNTWVGHSINTLIDSWGYPTNSFEGPNGNKVYVYNNSASYTLPTQTYSNYNVYGNSVYGNATTTGGQTINYSCQTFFEVNSSNIIINWRWKGNSCKNR
jgi:hypothetical protein